MMAMLWALLLVSAPVFAVMFPELAPTYDEEEEEWKEADYELPPFPKKSDLQPFVLNAPTSNRFMLDHATLSVGKDGVVRYVMVITASGGAETVTFEGIRCNSGEYRIYAIGTSEGKWLPSRHSEWRMIGASQPRGSLYEDYFCDGPAAPYSRKALLRQMENFDRGRP